MIAIIGFAALLVKHYIIPYRTIIKTGLGGPVLKLFIGNIFDYGGVRQHIVRMQRQEIMAE